MNIITITREYGAGGGEVARKLAEDLGWELLDRELLHQAAEVEHVPDAELERLDERAIAMADRFRLHPPHAKYLHGLKSAALAAAARGNVILVGRGARHLLGERPDALHVRLVAPRPWRAQRMVQLEGWSLEQAVARCTETDRVRDRFTRYFFGEKANQPAQYDLVFNTAKCSARRRGGRGRSDRPRDLAGCAGKFSASPGLDPLARAWGRRARFSAHARRAPGDAGLRPRIAGAGGRSSGSAGGRIGEDRRTWGRDLPAVPPGEHLPALLRGPRPAHARIGRHAAMRSSSGAVAAASCAMTHGPSMSVWWPPCRFAFAA